MTDNMPITPGSGGTVATEDWNNAHYQLVLPGGGAAQMVAGTAIVSGTANFAVLAAPGSGTCLWVTSITYINAGTIPTVLDFKDDATIVHLGYTDGTKGQGAAYPIIPGLRISDNKAFNVAAETTGGTVYVSAVGFKGP
jgi:hypothetical protein